MTNQNLDQRPFYCEILGVSLDATPSEIRDAYIRRAKIFHPDHQKSNLEQAKAAFQLLTEAYDYLKKNKFDRTAYAAPAPGTPAPASRSLTPYTFALSVFVAFFSGMVWQPLRGEPPTLSPTAAQKLFSQANDSFADEKYDDCVNSLVALDKIQHGYNGALELELVCTEGRRTAYDLAHWKPFNESRAPASAAPRPTVVDVSRTDLQRAICASSLPYEIEKMTHAPPLPEVKVIAGFIGINQGIAALSKQLRAQFQRQMLSTRIFSRNLNDWCRGVAPIQ